MRVTFESPPYARVLSANRLTEFYNNVRAPYPFFCNQCQCRRQSLFQRGRPLHNEARPHTCAELCSLPSGLLSTADSETTTLSIQTPFLASTRRPPVDDSWKVHWLTWLPALYEQVYHSSFRVAGRQKGLFISVTESGPNTFPRTHGRSVVVPGHL
ncbi:hypothetical protein EDC04DRAFT_2744695, partial [Pisolithus marmoratus]